MKKVGDTTLPGVGWPVKVRGAGGWCNPAILKITILRKILLVWSWILQYMLEMSFPSFMSKTPREIPIFRTFLAKNLILAYMSLKISNLDKISNNDVIVTSYTGCLYFFFWYVWKEETKAIPWYQIRTPRAFIFQVPRRVATTSLWSDLLQKIAW